ncbi:MFS transporter [Actinomadura sp. KC06]|uniref:MFS transporter n=1 Tax=Actinomadura sp. KC06 TaxID=2530369 RepID=UPI00105089E3|nr:MFS transporter [Actinomadura sp. KC06]TDD33756.1 MFS transporter [Actinomadura sp. KC06]
MTTTTTARSTTDGAARPRLMSRAFALVLVAAVGSSTSFYLLFSALPRYADATGAGGVGAGLTTGAMMLATVAAELAVPRLTARFGYRKVFGAGLALLGIPALALAASGGMAMILTACLVRGAGFAVAVVLGGALVASTVPAERRGEGLGVYGIACGVPAMLALPAGLWLGDLVGYEAVFVLAGVSALAGLAAVRDLPGRRPEPEEPLGLVAAARRRELLVPSLFFAATTVATGITATFLPLAGGAVSAWALLAHNLAATCTRWWAGRNGDRYGASRQLVPGLVISASGIALLMLVSSPAAVLAGMVLFGVGFGLTGNASMAVMLDRVPSSSYGTVSALWNVAYDVGIGVGATGFGFAAVHTGYPAAFGLTAALMLLPLLVGTGGARRRARAESDQLCTA